MHTSTFAEVTTVDREWYEVRSPCRMRWA